MFSLRRACFSLCEGLDLQSKLDGAGLCRSLASFTRLTEVGGSCDKAPAGAQQRSQMPTLPVPRANPVRSGAGPEPVARKVPASLEAGSQGLSP